MIYFIISTVSLYILWKVATTMYVEARNVKKEYEKPEIKLKSTVVPKDFEKNFPAWDREFASTNIQYIN